MKRINMGEYMNTERLESVPKPEDISENIKINLGIHPNSPNIHKSPIVGLGK